MESVNIKEAQQFLGLMFEEGAVEGDIEFRLIRGKEVKRIYIPTWVFPEDIDFVCDELADYNKDGFNIYYGVATRGDETHKPWLVPALWVDIDLKDVPQLGLLDKRQALMLYLQSCENAPHIIIDSGHGIHAYWWLYTAVGPELYERVQELNKKLAALFYGDSVSDVARILRVPGFYNVKDMDNPVMCRVLNVDVTSGYNLGQLDTWLTSLVPDRPSDEDLQALITNGNQGTFPSRSEADFVVCLALVKDGYSDKDIVALFKANPQGIGSKYAESGDKYLRHTIKKARILKGRK